MNVRLYIYTLVFVEDVDVENEVLLQKALRLCQKAKSISHPMIPVAVKETVAGAAEVVLELVRREVGRGEK